MNILLVIHDMSTPRRTGLKRDNSVISPPEGLPHVKQQVTVMESEPVPVTEPEPAWVTEFRQSFQGLSSQVAQLSGQLTTVNTQVKGNSSEISSLNKKVAELEAKNIKLESDVSYLKGCVRDLQSHLNKQEDYSRKGNVLFSGIEEKDEENCEEIVSNLLKDKLNMELSETSIIAAHRVGQKKQGGGDREILVRFHKFDVKNNILKNGKKLGENVYVNQDFCKTTKAARKVLWPIYQHAKSMDSYKKQVKLDSDCLTVKGTVFTVHNLSDLPQDLSPALISTPTQNGITLFFSKQSPLSNFYNCKIDIDGETYNCVEQFYTASKARMFSDERALYKIMNTDDPAKMKAVGNRIQNVNPETWGQSAPGLLEKGVHAKFSQNEHLKAFLLDTGENTLGEANSRDLFYGIGFGLRHKNAFKQQFWRGQNTMGQILMKVRNELS